MAETLALGAMWLAATVLFIPKLRRARSSHSKQPVSHLVRQLRVDLETAASERANKDIKPYVSVTSVELTLGVAHKDRASERAFGLEVTRETTSGRNLLDSWPESEIALSYQDTVLKTPWLGGAIH